MERDTTGLSRLSVRIHTKINFDKQNYVPLLTSVDFHKFYVTTHSPWQHLSPFCFARVILLSVYHIGALFFIFRNRINSHTWKRTCEQIRWHYSDKKNSLTSREKYCFSSFCTFQQSGWKTIQGGWKILFV